MSAQKFVVKKKAKTGGKDSKKAPKEAKPLVAVKEEVKEEVVVRLPPAKLNICVVGAGARGYSIAGYLRNKLRNVFMVVSPQEKRLIRSEGLKVEGPKGNIYIDLDVREQIDEKVDLVILAVDTNFIKDIITANRKFLDEAIILTTQNSPSAEKIISLILGEKNIVSSVFTFEAICSKPSLVNYFKDGKWYIGRPFSPNDDKVKEISEELSLAFEVVVVDDIMSVKWAKLLLGLYNCIPALLGKSLQEAFVDLDMAKLAVVIIKEGFRALGNSGIKLTTAADFATDKLRKLMELPLEEAAKSFSQEMINLGKEPICVLMLENIKKGSPSEVNYINGEFVHLSSFNSVGANLNAKIVNLIYRVEKTKKFFTTEDIKREFELDKIDQLLI